MRVRYVTDGAEHVVELDPRLDGYTIADLAAALGGTRSGLGGLDIDGCLYGPGTQLPDVALREGSRIEAGPANPSPSATPSSRSGNSPGPGPLPVLAITGGLQAGRRFPIPRSHDWVIGRAPDCNAIIDDRSVSRRHLRLDSSDGLRLSDLGSRNGTAVAGSAIGPRTLLLADLTVRLGATRLMWRTDPEDIPAALRVGLGIRAGRIPFNRPPRPRPAVDPAAVTVPAEPPPRPDPEPLSWAGIALPVVAGAVVAVLFSPFMAIFAALGPVLTIGTWLERRRRATRIHRQACRRVAEEVRSLRNLLPAAHAAERSRRLSLTPDMAEIVRRAETGSVRCWERRLDDPDAMKLGIATADLAYSPPLAIADGRAAGNPAANSSAGVAARAARDVIASLEPLADVPLLVSLSAGEVVGIVGPAEATRAMARALVLQAAVLHGPADLAIAVLAQGGYDTWSWARWLPHTSDAAGAGTGNLVVTDSRAGQGSAGPGSAGADLVEALAADGLERLRLVVVDGVASLTGRAAAGRVLLARTGTAGIVLVADAHELPASCTTIAELTHSSGGLRLIDPRSAARLDQVTAWGVPLGTARDAAARLARLEDPELGVGSAGLAQQVALLDLVEVELTPEAIERRWADRRGQDVLSAPIGADDAGPLNLDLVRDGPHLLIGGTTGSGKSELLRSLVAGLALSADPEHVAFVLIDYKGGAAFDRCADMPHTAGMVTDLDDRLAERALRCLEAELRYREERLRSAGVEDLRGFRAACRDSDFDSDSDSDFDSENPSPSFVPLPRLVVVVDEFATLASDLPEFLDSLVGIAQRGRSLGVHMVLATQRPAGVVTEDIRANTSCRIALRVTDRHDSNDVIDSPEAAAIPRSCPGRALARFGPGEVVAFQSALVTGSTPPATAGLRVKLPEALQHPAQPEQSEQPEQPGQSGRPEQSGQPESARSHPDTDLDKVVEALRGAQARRGGRPPRSPWPEPLPEVVAAEDLASHSAGDPATAERLDPGSAGGFGGFGPAAWLVDDPDGQRRFVAGWRPDDGHLIVVGGPGAGSTTTLAGVAIDLARSHSADDLHLYVIDLDAGELAVLQGLPHTGAVIGPVESERRVRLLRILDEEVRARRADGGRRHPAIVLLIDDLAGLARAHDNVREHDLHERFGRIQSEGPAVGLRLVLSVRRAADLPSELAAAAGVVLLHATVDPAEAAWFGLRTNTSGLCPGRAVRAGDGRELQVARFAAGDLAAAVRLVAEASPAARLAPLRVGSLPSLVLAGELPVAAVESSRSIEVRFAMSDAGLLPTGFTLHDGEHALILGPPRTGRTSTLAAIGTALGDRAVVVASGPTELTELLESTPRPPGTLADLGPQRCLLLVDDGETLPDPSGELKRLIADAATRHHIVAVARPERLRSGYGHWLSELRSCRAGVLFRPGPLDGDLLGVALSPRLELAAIPGRGLIVANAAAALAQVALVDPPSRIEP